ncbi:MAG TPA: DUF6418 domain-containing protein [Sphingomicrobium sp.]|nr:DUF6418 domain-containing protein [Sphingomicrobium sp.]
MISVATGLLGIFFLVLLWRKRPAAFVAGFFIIFQILLRLPDIIYLDLYGPVYSIQLSKHVGGDIASPYFLLACLCFLGPLFYMFRPSYLAKRIAGPIPNLPAYRTMQRFALIGCAAIIGVAYLDMFRIGTIPLFTGMDRTEYEIIAGPTYSILYNIGFMLTSALAIFAFLPRLQGGQVDIRFVALFIALMMFWVFTGNRFSIFYRDMSFFMIAVSALVWMTGAGRLQRRSARDAWSALISSRVLVPIGIAMSGVIIAGLLRNSYYNVRGYADPIFEMTQRIMVQPVELYASAWTELDIHRFAINWDAIDFLFFSPLATAANTTVQYLMTIELGYFRTVELIDSGTQYAGGYPEILLYVLGGWYSLPAMLIFGIITVALLRLAVLSISKGHLITALLAIYVYYGFTLFYIGGMLNFLTAPSYWLKMIALTLAYYGEGPVLAKTRNARTVGRGMTTVQSPFAPIGPGQRRS